MMNNEITMGVREYLTSVLRDEIHNCTVTCTCDKCMFKQTCCVPRIVERLTLTDTLPSLAIQMQQDYEQTKVLLKATLEENLLLNEALLHSCIVLDCTHCTEKDEEPIRCKGTTNGSVSTCVKHFKELAKYSILRKAKQNDKTTK